MNAEESHAIARSLVDKFIREQIFLGTVVLAPPAPPTWSEKIQDFIPWLVALIAALVSAAAWMKRYPHGRPPAEKPQVPASASAKVNVKAQETCTQEQTSEGECKTTEQRQNKGWIRKIQSLTRTVSAQAIQFTTGSARNSKEQISSPLSIEVSGLPESASTQTLVGGNSPSSTKSRAGSSFSSLASSQSNPSSLRAVSAPASRESLAEFPFPDQNEIVTGSKLRHGSPPESDTSTLVVPQLMAPISMKNRTKSRFSTLKSTLSSLGRSKSSLGRSKRV